MLYPIYAPGERYWDISPHADQSTAGAIMMVEGTFLALGVLAWVFFEVAREGIEKQRLLDLAHERGVELDERRAQRAVAAGHGALLEERLERREREPRRIGRGPGWSPGRWGAGSPSRSTSPSRCARALLRSRRFALGSAPMQTTVTELPGSRVEVEVEVPADGRREAASTAPPAASPGRCGCPASARARRRPRW